MFATVATRRFGKATTRITTMWLALVVSLGVVAAVRPHSASAEDRVADVVAQADASAYRHYPLKTTGSNSALDARMY